MEAVEAADVGAGAEATAAEWSRRFVRRMGSVGIPLGALICVYYAVWAPLRAHRDSPRVVAAATNLAALLVFAVIFVVLFRRRHGARVAAALRWIDERRSPTAAETAVVFRLPSKLALEHFGAMAAVGLLVATGNVLSGGLGYEWLRTLVGLWLFGATLSAVAYLTAEATLRPVFARFGDSPRSALGVGARLLVAWAVGSAVPLLFIAAIPLRGTIGSQLPTTAPLEFMAVSGLVIGAVTTVLVSRSIAGPLGVVRSGLRQVEGGDLSVAVPVDDPGEIGELQAAFNGMVDGLRERRLLQDMFGRHVGEDVARQALATGIHLGGETRDATVLFVDLVGSTAMAEQRGAAEVVELLNRFFGVVVGAVEAEGGWVDKFEGDGALAVFGVPTELDEHPRRALRAARHLAAALRRLGIDVGMGLATGELVAGNVGTERRFEYTVIGRPVNQAARLADLAKAQAMPVLASATVAAAAGDEARHWVSHGTTELRGIDHAVAIVTLATPNQPA